MTVAAKKYLTVALLAVTLIVFGLVFWFVGRPMIRLVSQPEVFQAWVDARGIWGQLIFLGMTVLQIIVAFIPGEPLEIAAGYAFGFWEGTLLCVLGILIGSCAVFFTVRRWGRAAVELFFSAEKIDHLRLLQNPKRLNALTFFLFLIPGTPKDLLTYAVGLTSIKPATFLLIACLARLPSVVTSTWGGHALGGREYRLAAVIFALTLLVSGVGALLYRRLTLRRAKRDAATAETEKDPD